MAPFSVSEMSPFTKTAQICFEGRDLSDGFSYSLND